jgi:hypothetical protein
MRTMTSSGTDLTEFHKAAGSSMTSKFAQFKYSAGLLKFVDTDDSYQVSA